MESFASRTVPKQSVDWRPVAAAIAIKEGAENRPRLALMTQKGSGFRPEVADIILINKDEIQPAPEVEIGEPSVIAGLI